MAEFPFGRGRRVAGAIPSVQPFHEDFVGNDEIET
jgi:hypothetical protein